MVSIAGAFRTGKSFLINWLLKYVKNGDDWMNGEPLEGTDFKLLSYLLDDLCLQGR